MNKYKDIPEYAGKYRINTLGDVIRVYKSGKVRNMTPYHKKMGGSQRLVVKLTKDGGKPKEEVLMSLMARTFLGQAPDGCVPYHRNGDQEDNCLHNIGYISRAELGRRTGARSRRQPVAKIDHTGEVVEVYTSARSAARENHMSYQTVIDRCNGRCKSAFAPDGYAYAWDDKEVSMRHALRKIELHNGYMPKATDVKFDF